MNAELSYKPVSGEHWDDFVRLFGPRGAYAGCWCMWWRKTRRQFEQDQGDGNKEQMQSLVRRGMVPGILVYQEGEPVGWCSIAPREHFSSLERSPVLKRLDERPVWSLVCLFVAKHHRNQALSDEIIAAALDYARSEGAEIVEAYPTVPASENLPPVSSFMGIPKVYERVGFEVCSQPSKAKLIMRYYLRERG